MFVKSDIEKAFESANKSKDDFLKKEILISSIGELLLKDKPDLVSLLNERNIATKTSDSDDIVVFKVLEQCNRSKDFCKKLMELILEKDGKSKSFFLSEKGRNLIDDGCKILKEIAKDNKTKNRILEGKMQHFFYNSEGTLINKSGILLKSAIYLTAGFVLYKAITMWQESRDSETESESKGEDNKEEEGGEVAEQ